VSNSERQRVKVICTEDDFDVLNDALAEALHEIMKGLEGYDALEAENGLTVYMPAKWAEEKLKVIQFRRLD